MGEGIFQLFLRHFTHEFANGDLIRKYTDLSCSVEEIREYLDFPSPKEEIHRIAWTHLLTTKKIVTQRPDCHSFEKYEYVKDVSLYGKVSYRKAKVPTTLESVIFEESACDLFLLDKFCQNKNQRIYVEIPFGILRFKDKERYQKILAALNKKDASYVDSMFLEQGYIYYQLDDRMEGIIRRLIEEDLYQGSCYVEKNGERFHG